METSRPASRSPASAAPTCRKSTEPMYESLVTLRRAHQLSARRASMTLCHGCDPRGAREWCGRWSKAHNRRSAIVRIPTGDPTSCPETPHWARHSGTPELHGTHNTLASSIAYAAANVQACGTISQPGAGRPGSQNPKSGVEDRGIKIMRRAPCDRGSPPGTPG